MNEKGIEEYFQNNLSDQQSLINPFPGLRPFGFEESHLFFGREGQSDEILQNLADHRFTAVLGASGSGKSSLLYCGIIPILYGGFMTNAGSDWTVIVVRPGLAPIENLAEAILRKDDKLTEQYLSDDIELEKTITSTILRSSSMGLVDAVKQITEDEQKNVFILVDQFEELFRFLKTEESKNARNEATAFVNLLIKSVQQTEVPVYVALTMRSDFIGDCSQFPELTHIINKSHYLIPQMTRDQQRLAIEGPVAVGGGKITKRLVQQLLNDVGNNTDQLPVMQHALMRTWDYWVENREQAEPIDLRHYIAVGRISEALSQHANEAYSELDKRQKEICEVLFKCLTERGADNIGVRRSARLRDICEISGAELGEVKSVIETFREPGRSLLMPPATIDLNEDSIIEISHESLMRIWQKLRTWVDEEAESAVMYRRLSEAAAMYQVGKTGLWRPPDLQLALNWQKKQSPTRTWAQRYNPSFERAILFLETSKAAYENEQRSRELLQKRMLRRTRNVAILLGFAAIISSLFFVFGWIQKEEAVTQAEIAERNANEARRQELLASQNEERAIEQANRAERERKAADSARLLATRNEKEALYQKEFAESQRLIAIEQRSVAEHSRDEAERANDYAQEQARIAKNERDNAYRLRLLSIAQSMAVKSLNISNDKDLKGLLAYQAFLFNDEYGGKTYDNYIYDGMYYALRHFEGEKYNILAKHDDNIRSIVFNNKGDKFYSCGSDGQIVVWNYDNMSAQTLVSGDDHTFIFYKLAVSPDDKWLIASGDAPYVMAINLSNYELTKIEGHDGPVTQILFPANNKYFITFGINDNKLLLNDYANSTVIKTFKNRTTAMAISNNGKLLISGTESGQLLFWNTENIEKEVFIETFTEAAITSIAFSPDDQTVAVGNDDGNVFICDIAGGPLNFRKVHALSGQSARINELSFSEDGELLASASWDGSVQMWVLKNIDDLPLVFRDHVDYVWSITFSKDSKHLIAGTRNGNIKVWPTRPDMMANDICKRLMRNMSRREWSRYVSSDIDYRKTCTSK